MLSVGAGRIVWIIFLSSIISLSFSLSLGIGPILTEILSHWAIKSYNHQLTNQIFPSSLRTLPANILAGICTCAGSACDHTNVFLVYGPCIGWMDR